MNLWPYKQDTDYTFGKAFFGAVKLTKYADPDKYKHSGYGIGFAVRGSISLSDGGGFGKNS